MKRSTRLLLALAIIEAGLAGLWFWLVEGIKSGESTPTGDPAQTVTAMSSTIGAVMGVLAGVVIVVALVMRRKGI